MKKKLVSIGIGTLVVGSIISLFIMNIFYNDNLTTEMRTNMISIVTVIKEDLSENDIDLDKESLENLSKETNNLLITLISQEGEVLVSSSDNPIQNKFDLLSQDDIKQASIAGVGSSIYRSNSGARIMCATAKLNNGQFIQISRPYKGYWGEIIRLSPLIILSLMIGTLMAVFIFYRLIKKAISPIKQFSQDIEKSARKKIKLNPDDYPYTELQSMAFGWNRLSSKVQRINKRRKSEHKRILAVANAVPEGFMMINNQESIILINDAACAILGCDQSVKGQSILHATRSLVLIEAVQTVFETKESKEIEIISEQGLSINTLINYSKQGVTILLIEENQTADTKKVRQQFFESASAELLTPIGSIQSLAVKLYSDEDLAPETREKYNEKIMNKIDNLAYLIEDIVQISQIENGVQSQNKQEVDFAEIVKESCNKRTKMANKKGVTLDYSVEPSFIYADKKDLFQIVDNLISNAIKYNYQNGDVSVKLYHQAGRILLRVFNTGKAIEPQDTGHIFERFSRIKNSGSEEVEGTGLGLSIVKHLVSQYNGGVNVIPQQGVGNTFVVSLPLKK